MEAPLENIQMTHLPKKSKMSPAKMMNFRRANDKDLKLIRIINIFCSDSDQQFDKDSNVWFTFGTIFG